MEVLNISNSLVFGIVGVNYCIVFFFGEKFWDWDCEILIKMLIFLMV